MFYSILLSFLSIATLYFQFFLIKPFCTLKYYLILVKVWLLFHALNSWMHILIFFYRLQDMTIKTRRKWELFLRLIHIWFLTTFPPRYPATCFSLLTLISISFNFNKVSWVRNIYIYIFLTYYRLCDWIDWWKDCNHLKASLPSA